MEWQLFGLLTSVNNAEPFRTVRYKDNIYIWARTTDNDISEFAGALVFTTTIHYPAGKELQRISAAGVSGWPDGNNNLIHADGKLWGC